MYVSIGGIDQWIQYADGAPNRPILLYLHGGPGGTSVPAAAAWQPWERHFTVVHWDQRGASRTFARNGAAGCGPLSVARMVSDGIEVAQHLIAALRQPKVLLVGHSWGSALAVHMIRRRPDLFSAFVGTGQLVNMRRNEEFNYRRQLEQAERRGNQAALDILRGLGPPPFAHPSALQTLREWADQLAEGDGDSLQPRPNPRSADFSADEVPLMLQGAEFSRRALYAELQTIDLPSLGTHFDLPMFFFEGTCDQQTPMALAEEYFLSIDAPHKEFVRFEGCHHFVVINRPDDFLRELLQKVRPHLTSTHGESVQRQFGPRAQAYLDSPVHAQGPDLERAAQLVHAHIPARGHGLDLGCGAGHLAFALAPALARIVAYDPSPQMLDTVARTAAERRLSGIETCRGKAESLPFADASFDLVCTRYSTHHWTQLEIALREMRRVLRPDGHLLIIDVLGDPHPLVDTHLQTIELLRDPSHVRNRTAEEWQRLLAAAGFGATPPQTWDTRLDFAGWIARMHTPPTRVAVIRDLQTVAPREVQQALALQPDGTFTVQTGLLWA